MVEYSEVFPLGYKGKLVEYLPGMDMFETSIKTKELNNSIEDTSNSSAIPDIDIDFDLNIRDDVDINDEFEAYIPNEEFTDANNQKICD